MIRYITHNQLTGGKLGDRANLKVWLNCSILPDRSTLYARTLLGHWKQGISSKCLSGPTWTRMVNYLLISLVPRLSSHAHRKGSGKLPIQFWYVCQDIAAPIRLQNSVCIIIFVLKKRLHSIQTGWENMQDQDGWAAVCVIQQVVSFGKRLMKLAAIWVMINSVGVPVKALTLAKDVFISIPTRTGKSLSIHVCMVWSWHWLHKCVQWYSLCMVHHTSSMLKTKIEWAVHQTIILLMTMSTTCPPSSQNISSHYHQCGIASQII